jgi:hypothetical protein
VENQDGARSALSRGCRQLARNLGTMKTMLIPIILFEIVLTLALLSAWLIVKILKEWHS